MKCYSELIKLKTLYERYDYLKLNGQVGIETFGNQRHLNQNLYVRDKRWKSVRDQVIIRDNGCDMALPEFQIFSRIIVHHIVPITVTDFMNNSPLIFDPENLICVSFNTHQAIHYGDRSLLPYIPEERTANDTTLWRK